MKTGKMSNKTRAGDGGPPQKRVKIDEGSGGKSSKKAAPVFDGVPALQVALGANGGKPSSVLVESASSWFVEHSGADLQVALTTLRNQFSIKYAEYETLISNSSITSTTNDTKTTSGSYLNALPTVIQTADPRLLFLEKWCSSSPGLEELFNIWDLASLNSGFSKSNTGNQQQGPAAISASVSQLTLNLFTSILTLLSAYYTYHPHAYPILKNLFTNDRWRRLCGYVIGAGGGGGSTSNDLIVATLRLLTVVVERWDAKKVLEGFSWEAKVCNLYLGIEYELTFCRALRNYCKYAASPPLHPRPTSLSSPTSDLPTLCSCSLSSCRPLPLPPLVHRPVKRKRRSCNNIASNSPPSSKTCTKIIPSSFDEC